eukprot:11824358-Karenia_brevis.AAC.1
MATYAFHGKVAKFDGGRGITNIHVPSVIVIDNSMPSAIVESHRCSKCRQDADCTCSQEG